MLRFEEASMANWRSDLHVAKAQERFVASPVHILARAWMFREDNARAYMLCSGEETVGMVLWYDVPEYGMYALSELMIDERYQRRGYAREAVSMALDQMAAEDRYPAVILCYEKENEAARRLYDGFGFAPCDIDEGDAEQEPCLSLRLDEWRGRREETT